MPGILLLPRAWFARVASRGAWQAGVALLALALLVAAAPSRAWDGARAFAAAQRAGPQAAAAVAELQQLLSSFDGQPAAQLVVAVNDFVNQHLRFGEDIDVWGEIDYWASPLESFERGSGDCEDYAIAKYFTLVAAGVAPSQLRLVYVRARMAGRSAPQAHMVLAFHGRSGADPLILDNLVTEVLPASQRRDLTPVFSFNSEGLWQGVNGSSAGDPLARLSRWREVLAKARAEGF